jgi:hypothetical protein
VARRGVITKCQHPWMTFTAGKRSRTGPMATAESTLCDVTRIVEEW